MTIIIILQKSNAKFRLYYRNGFAFQTYLTYHLIFLFHFLNKKKLKNLSEYIGGN